MLFQSSTAQKVAGLKAKVQELGLEGKTVGQVFSDLFGQHFSTAIAMAALHLLQGKGYISSLSIKKQPSPYSIKEQGKCRKSAVFMRFLTAFL